MLGPGGFGAWMPFTYFTNEMPGGDGSGLPMTSRPTLRGSEGTRGALLSARVAVYPNEFHAIWPSGRGLRREDIPAEGAAAPPGGIT